MTESKNAIYLDFMLIFKWNDPLGEYLRHLRHSPSFMQYLYCNSLNESLNLLLIVPLISALSLFLLAPGPQTVVVKFRSACDIHPHKYDKSSFEEMFKVLMKFVELSEKLSNCEEKKHFAI